MSQEIVIEEAEREGVPLLIGISAASGGGKTPSALRLARGLAAEPEEASAVLAMEPDVLEQVDRRIVMIDGDAKRSLFYAPSKNERPGHLKFRFRRIDWQAPFTCQGLEQRVDTAERAQARVIIIDSFSYVWDGAGGVVEEHDKHCDRAVERARDFAAQKGWRFDEDKAWDRASLEGWKVAKRPHGLMVQRLLQCRAHVIYCMHADDKMRIGEELDDRGKKKTTVTQAKDIPVKERWIPTCEKKFPRHLSDRLLLLPERPGYPLIQRAHDDHVAWINENKMIDETLGLRLAAWARGASVNDMRSSGPLNVQTRPDHAASAPPDQDDTGGSEREPSPPLSEPPTSSGDDFPGDRDAPDPYSDTPSGRDAEYRGQVYNSARPRAIEPAQPVMTAEETQLKQWAALMRFLIQHAPDDATRHEWRNENAADLLRLTNRSQALHGYALEFLPKQKPDADTPAPPATGTGDF